ncbi:MAG: hypothetical protein CVV23_12800 [Ignavibacteriae bacterium HGW-Ignavibacteriae-2]|jgi:hypothetical protein|nr:hypothetical protein [Bacteroidota bacterium]PKL87954.1 MAG: hypothetical protein CVV23_12800 [Ignavibacteriae bacterium HGW-Ignavibacteriae-2]
MKHKLITLLGTIVILMSVNLNAQDKNFGLGVIFGEPTGFSGKYWLTDNNALDFGFGYSFLGENSHLSLHGDYLYHMDGIIQSQFRIPIYYGFGLRLRTAGDDDGSFGVRGVAGVAMFLNELPVDVFFEIVPVFQLLPETGLKFDVAVGGRYYFK